MKLRYLLALLLAHAAHATDVTLEWDASPTPQVGYVLLWNVVGNTNVHRLDAGTATTVTLTNPPAGKLEAVCVAYALLDPSVESVPSNQVTWTNRPAAPLNLRVTVQTSTNLTHWQDGAAMVVPLPPQLVGQEFFRARVDLTQ